jgi:hypothetical protein
VAALIGDLLILPATVMFLRRLRPRSGAAEATGPAE